MKKIFLLGFMLAFFANIKGQDYIPFPMDSTIWSVNTTKYFVHDDTVIAGKYYSKVWMQTDSVEFEFDMDKASYFAAIRMILQIKESMEFIIRRILFINMTVILCSFLMILTTFLQFILIAILVNY